MSTEDISLRVERLEIESSKVNKTAKANPFMVLMQKRNLTFKVYPQNSKCSCHNKKSYITIFKKKQSKFLREPVIADLLHINKDERTKVPIVQLIFKKSKPSTVFSSTPSQEVEDRNTAERQISDTVKDTTDTDKS
ncbi:unnamed protein product [Leptidea sinapis]|uniref:Uncharacterized protein n=1 Tax=Leptidea sinapis TaxID=189913 RepID=A0A5E4PLV0_9NEOP|nr:unnamed protein product [Leptidea sinapis]